MVLLRPSKTLESTMTRDQQHKPDPNPIWYDQRMPSIRIRILLVCLGAVAVGCSVVIGQDLARFWAGNAPITGRTVLGAIGLVAFGVPTVWLERRYFLA
jgi:hypothetical protein